MRSDLPDDADPPTRDPRVKAAVAFSPTGTGVWGLTDDSWMAIDAPCMTFIGSLDFDFVITVDPLLRRVAFERSAGPDQYLVTLGWALTGAMSMGVSLGLALKVYSFLTPDVDEMVELQKGNLAVAILMASVVIAMGMVVAITVMPEALAPAASN